MKTTHAMCARFSALLFILLFSTTIYAGPPKVEVCHVPPGDSANFHTIKISEKALGAHLAHGDLAGACSAVCAALCDDGNACTVDDFGDCETNGCPASTIPVDCSDGNLCTDDICNPSSGCANPVAVTCEAPDLCTASTCDPIFGQCEETPMSCDEGESCNPSNGECEPDEPAGVSCPCYSLSDLQAIGAVTACGNPFTGYSNLAGAFYDNESLACSGDGCVDFGMLSCSTTIAGAMDGIAPISTEEDSACRALIMANCPESATQGTNSPAYQSQAESKPFMSID